MSSPDLTEAADKDSLDDGSLETAVETVVTTKKKRIKPSYYKPVHGFRLLFRTDIRRQIPLMYMNLRNAQDPVLYRNFLNHFKSKNCLFVTQYPSTTATVYPIINSTMDFNQIINQFAYRAVTCPDVISRLTSCELRRCKTSPGSEIVINGFSVGTKLYELPLPAASAASDPAKPSLPLNLEKLQKLLIPLEQPVQFMQTMECVFSLDANHSVYKIEARCYQSKYTPLPKTVVPVRK